MTQLSFLPPSPTSPRRPSEPIVRTASIEGNCRWELRRAWGSGPAIAWIGLNPSDANAHRDDPTMWREMGFSFRWGFGSLVKVNIYPFISASPAAMKRWRRSFDQEDGHGAREAWLSSMYRAAAAIADCERVMAAWGNGADDEDLAHWLDVVVEQLGRPIDLMCLGRTASGAPTHPLARGHHRIPDDAPCLPWRTVSPALSSTPPHTAPGRPSGR